MQRTPVKPKVTEPRVCPNNFDRRIDAISRVYQEVSQRRRVSQQQVSLPYKQEVLTMVTKMRERYAPTGEQACSRTAPGL